MKLFVVAAITLAVMTACSGSGTTYALGTSGGSSGGVSSTGGASGNGASGASGSGAGGSSGSGATPTTGAAGGGGGAAAASGGGTSAVVRQYAVTAYGVTNGGRLEALKTDNELSAEKRTEIESVRVVDGSSGKTLILPLTGKNLPEGAVSYADTFAVYKGVESQNPYTFVLVGEKTQSSEMPTTGTVYYFGNSHAVEKQADGSAVANTGTTFLRVDFGNKMVTGKVHSDANWRPLDGATNTGFDVNARIRGTAFQSVEGAETTVDGQFYKSESNRDNAAGMVMGVFSNQGKNVSGAFSGAQVQ